MSLCRTEWLRMTRRILAVIGLLAALPAWAQYPGQVSKTSKDAPELRAIGVLEWTGVAGKPTTSRIIPVTVLDEGELQDGGLYLARPEPLALATEVEYELQQDGKPVGLYDIKNAREEQGSWVGYGSWKPMPRPRSRPSAQEMAHVGFESDAQSDEPVLHRKHHAGDASAAGTGKGGDSGSTGDASPTDPDRPTLHKKSSSDSTGDAGTASASSSPSTDSGTAPAADSPADPDRPTLHKHDSTDSADSGSSSASAPPSDPDRPVLKKTPSKPSDVGNVESLPDVTDPDRPRLQRGKYAGNDIAVMPSMIGLPPDMQQAVAVSDARTHTVHVWNYAWANPDDEAKMKSALEDIARGALGLNPPAAAPKPKRTTAAQTSTRTKSKPAPAPPPAPLTDEQFRVFELAYGSGATLVLTAHTDGPASQEKFVTLVAQPDLYGNVLVLLKNVTDGAHLDDTPRMRLVDAVDALADNRGELLFEMRGATQRQFALYRVLRGRAEKLFVSGGEEFASQSSN
jgi:hypothetical protein